MVHPSTGNGQLCTPEGENAKREAIRKKRYRGWYATMKVFVTIVGQGDCLRCMQECHYLWDCVRRKVLLESCFDGGTS